MYVSNRKHGYKVVRQFKNGNVKLLNRYGKKFTVSPDKLNDNGYRFVKTKPINF